MSEIRVDNITDEAGTGAPGFSQGLPADALTGRVNTSNMPAGSVIQVVENSSSSTTQTNSNSIADVNPTVTITPSSTSNKILILHTAGGMVQDEGGDPKAIQFGMKRDGNPVWSAHRYGFYFDAPTNQWIPIPFHANIIDEPQTTSSVTYQFFMRMEVATGDLRHNSSDTSDFSEPNLAYTIAMEIKV